MNIKHLMNIVFMLCFTLQKTHPGLCVIIKNVSTSCEDIKANGNYIYNFERNWTKELDQEEWRNPNVLAHIDHRGNTVKKAELVAKVTTGYLETTECMNITYQAHDTELKEILVNFIVSVSQPEINGSKPVSSEHDVSSQTLWIILGPIAGTTGLLMIIGLIVWKMGYFRRCRRNRQDRREQAVNREMDQDQSRD